ncbi:DEAD/DEAH box helicase [Massilia timonae]|uniref:DEAD/DEAH box helicase n=1 Tax=Massilia timonae TaxID=47229 RepID=UPI002357578A|nr:AAA domain-containing protein [Massilia timonae]
MNDTVQNRLLPVPYWRAALAEVSLLHPEVAPDSKPIALAENDGAWRVAQAAPDLASWIEAQFNASKLERAGRIPFVLIPARLALDASHGAKQDGAELHKGASVLCIPCLLDRQGVLSPDPERMPWIPRELLEPTLQRTSVGALASVDAFIGALPEQATGMGDTFHVAARLFEAVTGAGLPGLSAMAPAESGQRLPDFALDEHRLVSGWHGMPYEPPVVARHLLKLYDRIIAEGPPTPLLDTLRTIADRPARAPLPLQQTAPYDGQTVGHMHPLHHLSPSQRMAMVELQRLGEGQVLAVNGPPGTGKTTLLQSVVAQLWVDAALAGGDCPLIVVASTNVKAVENVLDSFAKISAETGHRRWHPYGRGFGLFLASESRQTQHPVCTGKSHPFEEFETPEMLAAAERHYLDCAAMHFRRRGDGVGTVVHDLHAELKELAARLDTLVAARHTLFHALGQDVDDGAVASYRALLATLNEELTRCREQLAQLRARLDESEQAADAALRAYEARRDDIMQAEKAWAAYLADASIWLDLFSFVPAVRRRRMARDRQVLMAHPLTADLQHRADGVPGHFHTLKKEALQHKNDAVAELLALKGELARQGDDVKQEMARAETERARITSAFAAWRDVAGDDPELLDASLVNLNEHLDKKVRARMFAVADWYWSGQWILEVRHRIRSGIKDTKGRRKLEAKYRRFAKLSPCLVSNFHMAPSFFTAWEGEDMPFWNTIDLLVVDEAGQVSPDIGAPMFALARRAMVVGDTFQIEPVWNSGEAIDRANAVKFGLAPAFHDPAYERLEQGGHTPASGSLMRIANRSCTVQQYEDVRGLMLTEHRRSVPELIDYCNRLIYAGRLEPKRASLPPEARILPPFELIHVGGRDARRGGSRQNDVEAAAVVDWLKAHRADIEKHYLDDAGQPTPIWQLVGIVTPFAAQAGAIERRLRREMPDLLRKDSRLTVGTVHALQGAERAIVLFSPTYGESFNGSAFFDQTPNMLNVAVSRARDSFIVIGNRKVFDASRTALPSGLLATYLVERSRETVEG